MYSSSYEALLEYAGQPSLQEELVEAREKFIERTGPLFESDPSFEHRLTTFLEWFLIDRELNGKSLRPVQHFIENELGDASSDELDAVKALAQSRLELMEFRRWKDGQARFKDLITKGRWVLDMPEIPLGLESGDIVAGRVVTSRNSTYLLESLTLFPRAARKLIIKAAKPYKVQPPSPSEQIDFIHRLTYLANRGERYSHVDSREIFKALMASLVA
ncbi:MAG: hypothetical protein HOI23_04175 [Deltaproteobacteria bacterium]|jgi:hypothetical protein|nr:hypothetical protein [Deltaproteobacteria bacterium]MBT6431878.1 hypothetical protein [Deltaproteobacteria bacterium]MBT6492329.1 hypothetical protein [Deltaproteobacteria bacterium]